MSKYFKQVVRVFRFFKGFFPTPLPTGVKAFEAWADQIQDTYSLPTEDRDSIHYALATMIMHLGPTQAYKPNWYFVLAIRAGCAKQVAGATFQEIKLRQKALAEAAEAATKANEPQQQGV
jgi:hypothetical protein